MQTELEKSGWGLIHLERLFDFYQQHYEFLTSSLWSSWHSVLISQFAVTDLVLSVYDQMRSSILQVVFFFNVPRLILKPIQETLIMHK